MADKAISELVAAEQITALDLFVLEQNGTAKKLTGQVLLNWLTKAADGHGGIQDYDLIKTEGLVKTYRFTLADRTYMDIDVVDGRGVEDVKKTGTNDLVDTYTVFYNDGSTSTLTVTNGAKGDPGDTAYLHIKFASQEPTEASHSFGDVPDAWIGVYWGFSETAPTDWAAYKWYQIKGEKGDTGDPATLISSAVTYQVGDSGTIVPSGTWSASIPTVAQGKYLWIRKVTQFNTGNPITEYSISRMGMDGLGSVVSVAGVAPDPDGNVPLTAEGVKALPIGGGTMEGPINMNGQKLSGLNAPTEATEPATKDYADTIEKNAKDYAKTTTVSATLSASSWVGNSAPYTQSVEVDGLTDNHRASAHPVYPGALAADLVLKEACAAVSYAKHSGSTVTFVCLEDKPETDIPVEVEVYR